MLRDEFILRDGLREGPVKGKLLRKVFFFHVGLVFVSLSISDMLFSRVDYCFDNYEWALTEEIL